MAAGPEGGRQEAAGAGIWLADGSDRATGRRRGRAPRLGAVAAAALCLGGVGVPIGLVLTSGGGPAAVHVPDHRQRHPTGAHRDGGTATHRVVAALGATVDSGSFDVSYDFSSAFRGSAATTTTGTPTICAPGSEPVSCPVGPDEVAPLRAGGYAVTGKGTIDTGPFAMVVTSTVPGLGTVTIRENGTDVWEEGGADYGLSPGNATGGGATLSGFASLVEGTLGQELGAEGMEGLASPTGYLQLAQSGIAGATLAGNGTVDGTAVTVYRVTEDHLLDPTAAGLTAQEEATIEAADAILLQDGWQGEVTTVSVDAAGFIHKTVSVVTFADGLVSSDEATFSDFGCAGTVLMPGQTGPATPPVGCVSPDTGAPPVTTTTSTTDTTTTTGAAGMTTTTGPGSAHTTPPPPPTSVVPTTAVALPPATTAGTTTAPVPTTVPVTSTTTAG
jgi:hypothetical protein